MADEAGNKIGYPHFELTGHIIAAAMKVHSELGPGYVERIYENALMQELRNQGIAARNQVRYQVYYDGHLVGEHVLDIVVDGKVYVELKAQKLTGLEEAQVISGLKAGGLKVGLLINFNVPHLRSGIKRLINPNMP